MPRDISVGWWGELARAIFGHTPTAPLELEDYIRAVAILEGERAEYGILRGERRWMTTNISQAAIAARFGFLAIRNPVNSGVLVVVEDFVNTGSSVLFKRRKLPDATFEAAITSEVVVVTLLDTADYTDVAEPNSAAKLITGIPAAGALPPTPSGIHSIAAAGHIPAAPLTGWPLAILRPGSYLAAEGAVVNTALSGYFLGRERPLYKPARGV